MTPEPPFFLLSDPDWERFIALTPGLPITCVVSESEAFDSHGCIYDDECSLEPMI